MGFMQTVSPFLEGFRGLVGGISEKIAGHISLQPENISVIIFILFSLYFAKAILQFFYDRIEEHNIEWLIVSAVLFWFFKFGGVQ